MTASWGPDASQFYKQLWGVSPDGVNWTWYRLLTWTGDSRLHEFPAISLQAKTIAGVRYFYGFTEIWSAGGIGTGVIRLHYNAPRARKYDRVEVWAQDTNRWEVAVSDPDSNPDGDFTVLPKKVWDAIVQPRYIGNPGELWYSRLNVHKDCQNCGVFSGSFSGAADRILYRAVTLPTSLNSLPILGIEYTLKSQVRCMPGEYEHSRMYPQPLAPGSTRLLYTSVNDDDFGGTFSFCGNTHLGTFGGMYIVVTGLKK